MSAVDRLVPSVEDAEDRFNTVWFIAEQPCAFAGQSCLPCGLWWQAAENAAPALDMALSVGRRFDRDRQQAVWQAREDAALVRSVAF